jgi:hypothetical protein
MTSVWQELHDQVFAYNREKMRAKSYARASLSLGKRIRELGRKIDVDLGDRDEHESSSLGVLAMFGKSATLCLQERMSESLESLFKALRTTLVTFWRIDRAVGALVEQHLSVMPADRAAGDGDCVAMQNVARLIAMDCVCIDDAVNRLIDSILCAESLANVDVDAHFDNARLADAWTAISDRTVG